MEEEVAIFARGRGSTDLWLSGRTGNEDEEEGREAKSLSESRVDNVERSQQQGNKKLADVVQTTGAFCSKNNTATRPCPFLYCNRERRLTAAAKLDRVDSPTGGRCPHMHRVSDIPEELTSSS